MKILLIIPNPKNTDLNRMVVPTYIANVASTIRLSHEVKIVDTLGENKGPAEIEQCINGYSPDLVGISCNYSPMHNPSLHIAKMAKQMGCKVVLGGNHATALADIFIQSPYIDAVVCGDGQHGLIEAIKGEGIISPKPKMNLDDTQLPAYDLLPMKKYKIYNIMATLGCPFHCTYCASSVIHKEVKYRSPKHVVSEMNYLIDNWGRKKRFWFTDDTFTLNRNYATTLCGKIEPLEVSWSCLARVDGLTNNILRCLKGAGCDQLSLGIESGSERILEKIKKGITVKDIKRGVSLVKDHDLITRCFFMIGLPTETVRDVELTMKLIHDIKPDFGSFGITLPLPGTELWNDLIKSNAIDVNTVQWDYFFALTMGTYPRYVAELASKWCELSPNYILDMCNYGNSLYGMVKT